MNPATKEMCVVAPGIITRVETVKIKPDGTLARSGLNVYVEGEGNARVVVDFDEEMNPLAVYVFPYVPPAEEPDSSRDENRDATGYYDADWWYEGMGEDY